MKISDHSIVMSAARSEEEIDASLKQETRRTIGRSFSSPFSGPSRSAGLVDRVSLSHSSRQEYQSEYTGSLNTRSVVSGPEETRVFEQKNVVQRLVGAVIDREVVVTQLRNGDDIQGPATSRGQGNSGQGNLRMVSSGSRESLATVSSVQLHYEAEAVQFESKGTVQTEDGRTIEFSLDFGMDRALLTRREEQTLVHRWQEAVNLTDPLVISLDGTLPDLTDTRFAFDLDNDGQTEEISFVGQGAGFLAFDRNQDQKINNGSELFGPGTGNGFGELAIHDQDGNGWIDENDSVFSQLSVWTRDSEGNDHLISLKEAGLGAIYLGNAETGFDQTDGENQLKGRVRTSGMFLFETGEAGVIQQVDLAEKAETADAMDRLPGEWGNTARLGPGGVGRASGFAIADTFQENPLKELMDQVEALKNRIREIFDQDSSSAWPDRKKGDKQRSLSKYQQYWVSHPDPTVLLSGKQGARAWQV